ncbi:hypothetical protein Btru_053397 [Bulinus truncatus]|nr:hypothetical protein Btru_053397 [Bulinus truncatus]
MPLTDTDRLTVVFSILLVVFISRQDARKFIPLLTPEEALACKWLRLTPQQVKALEDLIRAKGLDPGIHEHSSLKDYDVFAEIRQLRQAAQNQKNQDIIEENEEGENASMNSKESYLSSNQYKLSVLTGSPNHQTSKKINTRMEEIMGDMTARYCTQKLNTSFCFSNSDFLISPIH